MTRHPGLVAFGLSALAFAGIALFLRWYASPPATVASAEPVVVHCADALRVPLEAIRDNYLRETGQRVELRIGASQTLLAQIEIAKDGDLYLPADDSFLDLARKKNLVRETLPLATMNAVVAYSASAKPIASWADFVAPGRDLILASPEATAIGKATKAALVKSGRWADVEKRKPTFQGKISEAASAVLVDPRGACILFDAVAAQFPKLKTATLPELADIRAKVAVAVLAKSKQPTAALRFARYLAASDRGLDELSNRGYAVVADADAYEEHPELRLFGGTMLRPAIEKTIREFEEREGVTVHTNWNGCGILVGEMQTKKIPDIYFACEPRFLQKVQEHFGPADVVSTNRLVLAVRKGNPFAIESLKDLGKEGLKVGVGNENQCALGDLTKTTFIRTGLYGRIRRNIAKEAPSGDLLISDFRGGALDVIVCYESNVVPYRDEFDQIPVDIGPDSKDCTNPEQPVAVAKATAYPQLAARLMAAFRTPESRARFEALGFGWAPARPTPASGTSP